MAVWGTPVAREDDVERRGTRRVELVDAVAALRHEVSAPDLAGARRRGDRTGRAARLAGGGRGRGRPRQRRRAGAGRGRAGHRVGRRYNPPGHLDRDRVRGRWPAASKGRPSRSTCGGRSRSSRCRSSSSSSQARFVGTRSQLRLVKELFHAGVSQRAARLVAVYGPAGVGKSRLRAEFLEYLMQLPDSYLWHPGRCLPYGDGVASGRWPRSSPPAGDRRGRSRFGCGGQAGGRAGTLGRTRRARVHLFAARRPAGVADGSAELAGGATGGSDAGELSPAGGCSSSGWPSGSAGRPGLRGHAPGPTMACSTSSSTCSTGPPSAAFSSLRPSPGRSCPSSGQKIAQDVARRRVRAPRTSATRRSTCSTRWRRCR